MLFVLAIGFLLGHLLGAFLPAELLQPFVAVALLLALALPQTSLHKRQKYKIICALLIILLGLGYFQLSLQREQAKQLPAACGKTDALVIAKIKNTRTYHHKIRVTATVQQWLESTCPSHASNLSLNWYRAPQAVQAGQVWQLKVRLKPNHGLKNPYTFDYESYLLRKKIHATGYIKQKKENVLLAERGAWQASIQQIQTALAKRLTTENGLLAALATGDKSGVSAATWQTLSRLQLTHLFVISGMHLGMIFILLFLMLRIVLRYTPLRHQAYARLAIIAASLCGSGFFALLSGLELPAQRAMIMLTLVAFWLASYRYFSALASWSLALILVLIFDALAVISMGFWLSFGLLLFILLAADKNTWQHKNHWLKQFLLLQLKIAVLLIPFSLWINASFTLVSPLVNGLMILLFQFVLLPLILLLLLASPWQSAQEALTQLLDGMFTFMLQAMVALDDTPWLQLQWYSPSLIQMAIITLALAWFLLGLPKRALAVLPLCSMLLLAVPKNDLAAGEFRLTLFDVGQGVAQLIQTKNYALLVDSANVYPNFNLAQGIIAPFLRHQKIKPDALLISSKDKDHAGGAPFLLQEFTPLKMITNDGQAITKNQTVAQGITPCLAGDTWQWDSVSFEVLHPSQEVLNSWRGKNDKSCVLKISGHGGSALLPADIEKRAEKTLLATQKDKLKADILVVPHHGSRSSSTTNFIKSINPQYAVFSVGYLNRYRHPHKTITARYKDTTNAQIIRTDITGAVTFKVAKQAITVTQLQPKKNWHKRVSK